MTVSATIGSSSSGSGSTSSSSSSERIALPEGPETKLASRVVSGDETVTLEPSERAWTEPRAHHSRSRAHRASALPEVGDRVGPYLLERVLGKGGMGAVYLGVREDSGLTHAIKVLIDDVDGFADEDAQARFRREAQLMARVDAHEGIVSIHGFGVDDGLAWYAMDRIDGEGLDAKMRLSPAPPRDVARIVAAIARAVHHLHRNGVVHRDLKPANVILDASGRPRLLDFGIARDQTAGVALTKTGEVLGTPSYMAPEQAVGLTREAGGEVGPRADVYGLGAILYALLTGHAPFEGPARAVIFDVISKEPTPPRELAPRLEPELDAICRKALAKEPDDRYPSAAALASDLERFVRGDPVVVLRPTRRRRLRRWLARRAKRIAIGGVIASSAAALVMLAAGRAPEPPDRDADPAARLAALTGRLVDEGTLGRDGRADVERLLEGRSLSSSSTDRARLILALDRAAADHGNAERVARSIRATAAGSGDREALSIAQRALLRAERLDILAFAIAIDPEPELDPAAAAALARAVTEDGSSLPVPTEDTRFAALIEAPGIDDATRGRLRVRRAETAMTELDPVDPAAQIEAIASWIGRARRRDGIVPDPERWPASFHAALVAAFRTQLEARRTDQARSLLDLLILAAGDHELAVGAVAALQRALHPPSAQMSADELEALILVAALLEASGMSPLGADQLTDFWVGLPHAWAVERAAVESARSPEDRNAAVLVLLARIAAIFDHHHLPGGWTKEDAAAWVEAASEAPVDEVWLHLGTAYALEWLGRFDAAVAGLERAHALDLARPIERRWPVVSARLIDILVDVHEDDAEDDPEARAAIDRALSVGELGIAIARIARERVRAIVEAGGTAPWGLAFDENLVRQIYEAVEVLTDIGPPHCCAPAVPDTPTIDDVLDRSLDLFPDSGDGSSNRRVGSILYRRGRHHHLHGRRDAALADYDLAIESRQRYLRTTPNARSYDRRELEHWIARRARLLRR